MSKIQFTLEIYETQEEIRQHIQECEGKHSQQVAYSSFHDVLTQVCFTCKKVRTNKRKGESRRRGYLQGIKEENKAWRTVHNKRYFG